VTNSGARLTSNPAAVTLTPAGKLPAQSLQRTITAAGLLDAKGRPIDGQGSGQPGSNFVGTFKG
jgi:hypothetical protein